ncbi:phosphoenolpyruvate carboxylase type 1 [Marinicella litoralis]|uniref:Phosphoenolpyruvate carboxylase n=2 Tax=Marinicella litoralis TaxID=644220 RepID=A0A4V3DIV8_9GAMM|nr:phosphoenolpyruvate carboxylase type 1 [Marinicella litoralis]
MRALKANLISAMKDKSQLVQYRNSVLNKYQIYNSLFLNLPFDAVYKTGVLLPLLTHACVQGYQEQQSPYAIISGFFAKQESLDTEEKQISALFKFIQYIERQIVLFDSIEEAGYEINHDLNGKGSVPYLANQAEHLNQTAALRQVLQSYRVRVVLTAHPTQFYPGPVLGIMTDLSEAIKTNDLVMIEQLLQQLGKTPLFSKSKPTPFDEAVSLIWYLENVFYNTVKHTLRRIQSQVFADQAMPDNTFIELGFWPGGDRDGNPFVDSATTIKVADRLHRSILKCYYRDVRALKKRLTFEGVDEMIERLEQQLYQAAYMTHEKNQLSQKRLLEALTEIHQEVKNKHHSLFIDLVQDLINQVKCFGLYFATLDIRQDSRVHHQVMIEMATETAMLDVHYADLTAAQQMAALNHIKGPVEASDLSSTLAQDTLNSVLAIEKIQKTNGEFGANRYIISNCQSALNVMEVLAFFQLAGWSAPTVTVDIVPLFETIDDLMAAPEIMASLYQNPKYQQHLSLRKQQQTIMLGFSDGTKDGGYLAANWSILTAKEKLTAVSRKHGVAVVFFDGRGGPPARGGGETHKFYASQSPDIANHATQLTVQGQTISSNFGNTQSAQYNLEQLLSAGLSSAIFPQGKGWDDDSKQLLGRLSELSLEKYSGFKQHPKFIPYLEKISTLKYYGMTNIGSRPSKRSAGKGLVFEDLRAIPFVGAWSQLKQNVLGYYGVGTACETLSQDGLQQPLQTLYQQSGYFKALIDNSMMSICKSFMPLTAYLQQDPEFGGFWDNINDEFKLANKHLKSIAEVDTLLLDQPLRKESIRVRESIVLPLLTIQQYCLQKMGQLARQEQPDKALMATYEKLVTRSLYGNINAARNAV